jgi:CheY-like chemotaxis protein
MNKCILVVDDDREVREILSFVLKHHGFEVIVASNGAQIQPLLLQRVPDLILLDVMMPGEDGFRLCRYLRQSPLTQHIPIMIMTAHAEDIYQRISRDVGASQHITKPFHPLDLAEKVKALLDTKKIEN